MSRIGNLPVSIPSGVNVQASADEVQVKGPKGALTQGIADHVAVKVDGDEVVITRTSESQQARANHGLMRSLISNMVNGTHKGFSKRLEVLGVGYRADVRGNQLVMNLGFSHPIEYGIPDGISISVDKNNKITIEGPDKQQVGQVAAELRAFRKPDHYKGKGVRYEGERVRLKAGKSAT